MPPWMGTVWAAREAIAGGRKQAGRREHAPQGLDSPLQAEGGGMRRQSPAAPEEGLRVRRCAGANGAWGDVGSPLLEPVGVRSAPRCARSGLGFPAGAPLLSPQHRARPFPPSTWARWVKSAGGLDPGLAGRPAKWSHSAGMVGTRPRGWWDREDRLATEETKPGRDGSVFVTNFQAPPLLPGSAMVTRGSRGSLAHA